MAASIAAPVAATAIEKLVAMTVQHLANEASLVFNFREDFRWMTRELTIMKGYLNDAHRKSAQNDAVKLWLSELRDVACDAEDIVDECAAEHKTNKSCALSCSGLIFKHKIGRRIRDLKARMNSIVADATRLHLFKNLASTGQASTSSSTAEKWKRSSFLERNARPVAIEDKVDDILRLLDDGSHPVIAVSGMGGVGKTFLLQNVYNDPRTKRRFEKCIWLSVSQTYSLQKLQSDIASSLDLRDVVKGHLSEQRSAELIHDSLHGKKFLIVLDDVWRATEHDNLIERLGVSAANTQCKIVVTTRNMEVCRVLKASSIYKLRVLKEKDSWDLFCAYAFADYPEKRPPQHLEKLARQVESECGKLPLALKTVGASMANETLAEQWESKLQKLKAVRNTEDPIMEILQLSYDSLPADVKPCFLYFAFFGEDEKIDVEYVIELWKAEGFIPEDDAGREIGFDYFYQLSNLCLVEEWEDHLLERYCKIHDLLLDLAIYICKENRYGFSLDAKYSTPSTQYLLQPDKNSGYRHLFLANQGIVNHDVSNGMLPFPAFLRTLSLRGNAMITNFSPNIFRNVRALRVLDMSQTSISTLPSSIGCLKLLRVLNLEWTNMEELPSCIRSLKNLRVLNISETNTSIERVPDWIGELKCLQILNIGAKSVPKRISELFSLRVLILYDVMLSVEENDLLRLEDVGKLIRLQELRMDIHSEAEIQRMEEGVLEHLVNMRRLDMRNLSPATRNSDDIPNFSEKFRSMKHLEYLGLLRFVLSASSSWIYEFVSLRVLFLRDSPCTEYPSVELLPNLISLRLWGNRKCRELKDSFGKCGAFPKLRFLDIQMFPMLEELPVLEEGSMPCLEEFTMRCCMRVGRVPEGLEHLKSLKVFSFELSGTYECRQRLGEVRRKIEDNNPHVQIHI